MSELRPAAHELRAHMRDDAADAVPILEIVVAFERRATAHAQVVRGHAVRRHVGGAARRVERMTERRRMDLTASIRGADPAHARPREETLLFRGHSGTHRAPRSWRCGIL